MGCPVGICDGTPVGSSLGMLVGSDDGSSDGCPVGHIDGCPDGSPLGQLGSADGTPEGSQAGAELGSLDGCEEGCCVILTSKKALTSSMVDTCTTSEDKAKSESANTHNPPLAPDPQHTTLPSSFRAANAC